MSGEQFDDPNRESLGLDPIWTDAENPPVPDGDPEPEPEPEAEPKKSRKQDDE